jgi:tetratricopeptide (TPR) repeat protein
MWEYDFAGAEKALKRAIAIDPGYSRAHEWLALVYHWTRRPADALGEAQRAVEHDPLSPSAHAEVARALCANRQYDQGLARLKRIEAVKPPLLRAPLYSGLCYAMKKDWPAAIAAVRQAQGHQEAALRGHVLARAGQQVQALALLTAQIDRWERTRYGAFEVAVIYAGFGNRDQTFEWLNRSIDDLSLAAHGQRMLPLFDDLHADPRFEQFRRRLGLQNL